MSERDEYITKMWNTACEMLNDGWTWDKSCEVWDMCSDWNRTHDENEEIFMCEHVNDEGAVDGFYIEHDYLVFEDMN